MADLKVLIAERLILTAFSERVQNSYKGISGRLRPVTALRSPPELSQFVLPFEETGNIRYLHSSGHATSTDTQLICNAVMPKKGIIPIHTENGEAFKELVLKCPILHLKDGEILSL